MKKQGVSLIAVLIALAGIGGAPASQASLIPATPAIIVDSGSGFGHVNTVLTLDNNRNGMANGGVGWDGDEDVTYGDDAKQGGDHFNNTYSFGSLGINEASAIRIIFNPAEPGSDANSVTLTNLVLNIYNTAGLIVWNSGVFTAITFPVTESGIGKNGFAFMLDEAQAADAQAFILDDYRMGLYAEIASATGAMDTFLLSLADEGGGPPDEDIPEPGSVALLGLGLAAFGFARRKKSQR